ncbi:NifU family protein [Candidatus Dependentiae bacterium]
MSKNIVQEIKKVLNAIGKELELHDGGVQFIDFKDGILYLSLDGACIGCPASACGLMANVEQKLKMAVPEIRDVVVL